VNTTTVTRSQVPPHSTTLTFLHLAHLSIRYDTIPPIPPTETKHAVIPLPSPSMKQNLTSYSRPPTLPLADLETKQTTILASPSRPPSLPQTLSQTQNPSHDTTCRLNPTAPPYNRNIDPTGKQTKKKAAKQCLGSELQFVFDRSRLVDCFMLTLFYAKGILVHYAGHQMRLRLFWESDRKRQEARHDSDVWG